MATNLEKGGISVQTEHIFPIIKRWLYSDKEIFLRELVSNACDAITKLKRLNSLGKANCNDDFKITISLDKELKTLTITDNGIGMTQDEIKKFINQIALSGALEFIQKYEGESEASDGIIGHFGLGFYSAFMVANTVELKSLSFIEGSEAAYWNCSEQGEFEMGKGDYTQRGTSIILHITEEEKEFLEKLRIETVLKKYCAFMPYPIYFDVVGETDENTSNETPAEDKKPINNTTPLWLKSASDCTDEEYKAFYKELFHDYKDPLFYIHINADYPLNFKGIIYFPSLSHEYENLEGQVKLYYNQVFVADNIKEVIPDYLMLLKGVLDCPELPLNVSRSYLQNSGYVTKISTHITKKIADKLNSLFTSDRKAYESFWDDIKPFVEYGSMKDHKFFERVKDIILFKTTDGDYLTKDEYLDKLSAVKANEKSDGKQTIYYATSMLQQVNYINLFREQGITVVLLDALIDSQFISYFESQNDKIKFIRIDCDTDALKSGDAAKENKNLKSLFKEVLGEKTEISFEKLKSEKTPAIITLSEEQRRFADMMKMYQRDNQMPPMPGEEKLVINLNCKLFDKLEELAGNSETREKAKAYAKQIYSIALISQRVLTADELSEFVEGSVDILYNM